MAWSTLIGNNQWKQYRDNAIVTPKPGIIAKG